RSKRDWSSDVCSSDLAGTRHRPWGRLRASPAQASGDAPVRPSPLALARTPPPAVRRGAARKLVANRALWHARSRLSALRPLRARSEERRVGKESGWHG